jgi:L1 cell adhesion molecule like protein
MPPEYIMEGIVSKMYDVYSFGVTLLEIISGMCRSEPAHRQASIEWVRNKKKTLTYATHPSISILDSFDFAT